MRWVQDYTHRFAQYPFYEDGELDAECESLVEDFLREKTPGIVAYPLSTDDLKGLIEKYAEDLDWTADLSVYGQNVEGITHFKIGGKPRVEISHQLVAPNMGNRFRMTLAHELGHVKFHNCLYQLEPGMSSLFKPIEAPPLHCKRESIVGAGKKDWMEWQAAYVGGALLMPITRVRTLIKPWLSPQRLAVSFGSREAAEMSGTLVHAFGVSEKAARVRLSRLGILSDNLQFTL